MADIIIFTRGKPFYIAMINHPYKVNDILEYTSGKCVVLKVYRKRWWKSLITAICDHYGIKVKFRTYHLKVKTVVQL